MKLKSLKHKPLFLIGIICYIIVLALLLKLPFIVVLGIDLSNHFDFVYMGIVIWTPLIYLLRISLQVFYKIYLPNYKEKLNLSPCSVHTKYATFVDFMIFIVSLNRGYYIIGAFLTYCGNCYPTTLMITLFLAHIIFYFLAHTNKGKPSLILLF